MRTAAAGVAAWLRRRAENIAAGMLAAMFVCFIIQVIFRYLLNFPVGWTVEVCTITWLWVVLWGTSFVVREPEEIRFDILYGAVRPGIRRAFRAVTACILVAIYAASFPAVLGYVRFMKVEHTAYLGIRFDYLFSIYLVFAVAMIARYARVAWQAFLGAPEAAAGGGRQDIAE